MRSSRRLTLLFALVLTLSIGVLATSEVPSPATARVQIGLADTLFEHADYRAAMRLYLRASECRDVAVRDRARAGVVRSALRIAEFGVAVTHMTSLRSALPGDPDTLALAGDALWAAGRFDEAEAAYGEALTVDVDHASARHGSAKALASRGRLDEALEEVQRALRRKPREAAFLHTLGYIYERQRRFDDAAAAYEQFLANLKRRERDEPDVSTWARHHVSFLRSFEGLRPFETSGAGGLQRHTVGFKEVAGKIIVQASINGGKPIDFALDTGAERTVLSERTAARAGVRVLGATLSAGVGLFGVRDMRVGRIQSLRIGTLTIKHVPCLIKSPASKYVPIDETEAFSPVALGLSMTVDYRQHRVTIGESLPPQEGALVLPLRQHRLVSVPGVVDGRPANFIVDTGGEGISLSSATARGLFQPIPRQPIRLRVFGASGWDPDAYLLPGVNLAFGSVTLANQPVVVLNLRAPSVLLGYEIGGIVGHRFLSRYRVDFDMRESVLRLVANP